MHTLSIVSCYLEFWVSNENYLGKNLKKNSILPIKFSQITKSDFFNFEIRNCNLNFLKTTLNIFEKFHWKSTSEASVTWECRRFVTHYSISLFSFYHLIINQRTFSCICFSRFCCSRHKIFHYLVESIIHTCVMFGLLS